MSDASFDAPPFLGGVHVLLIEHDHDSLEVLKAILEYAGALVAPATSAREALRALERIKPDVIVVDLAMPGEDGYRLIGDVRSQAHSRPIPAIARTGLPRPADRRRAHASNERVRGFVRRSDPEHEHGRSHGLQDPQRLAGEGAHSHERAAVFEDALDLVEGFRVVVDEKDVNAPQRSLKLWIADRHDATCRAEESRPQECLNGRALRPGATSSGCKAIATD